jgi:hypothetical protein
MGDWEDYVGSAGMSADYEPWESPCWNDDWEHEIRNNGNKTVEEWKSFGRRVKKGAKGTWLPCAKISVFNESQTSPTNFPINSNSSGDKKKHFDSFEKAISWAKENPGKPFTRSPDGNGFIEK